MLSMRVDGEMNGERRAGRGEGGELLASGMREARPRHARQHHALRHFRHGQLAASAAAAAAKAGTPGVSV